MVVVAISITMDLYNRIETLRDTTTNGKAILFKRSPYYAKLLETGLKIEEEKHGRTTIIG